jgi:hypothetical protein
MKLILLFSFFSLSLFAADCEMDDVKISFPKQFVFENGTNGVTVSDQVADARSKLKNYCTNIVGNMTSYCKRHLSASVEECEGLSTDKVTCSLKGNCDGYPGCDGNARCVYKTTAPSGGENCDECTLNSLGKWVCNTPVDCNEFKDYSFDHANNNGFPVNTARCYDGLGAYSTTFSCGKSEIEVPRLFHIIY